MDKVETKDKPKQDTPASFRRYADTDNRRQNLSNYNRSAFTVDAEVDDEDNDYIPEKSEIRTIICDNFLCGEANKTSLIRVDAEVFYEDGKFTLPLLIDSGSTTSFINPRWLPNDLRSKIEYFKLTNVDETDLNLKSVNLSIRSALSTQSSKCAVANIKFSINEWFGSHEFVFADLTETAILGMDFLKRFETNFNFSNKSLVMYDKGREYNLLNRNESINKRYGVCLATKVVLKPKSENLVKVRVPEGFKSGEYIIFKPNLTTEADMAKGVVWASSVSDVKDDKTIYTSVLNTSSDELIFDKDTDIGEVDEAEIVDEDIFGSFPDDSKQEVDMSKFEINQNLSELQRSELVKILEKHKSVFQWNEYETGRTEEAKHDINTGDAIPIKQKQYRLPQTANEEVDKQVKKMLNNDIIEESKSPWCSPIILVKKKAKENCKPEFRLCIDFKKLNQVTIKDSYPLPRIDETVDAIR